MYEQIAEMIAEPTPRMVEAAMAFLENNPNAMDSEMATYTLAAMAEPMLAALDTPEQDT